MDLLTKVQQLEENAAAFGFRWETTEQIMEQIQSECSEIHEHLAMASDSVNRAEFQEEIGDLLHAVFSLCVFCNFSPSETLKKTLLKFEKRLNAVKKLTLEQGLTTLDGLTFEELMRIWEDAKELVG
jgi:uncharacterized protein YabN with tetrapyrrole methylase and pyrophosphatase domain